LTDIAITLFLRWKDSCDRMMLLESTMLTRRISDGLLSFVCPVSSQRLILNGLSRKLSRRKRQASQRSNFDLRHFLRFSMSSGALSVMGAGRQ